jgi:hypothetical protein
VLKRGLLTAAGEGAFSQVVLARHKDTKKLVALKVVYLQSPEMDDEHLVVTRKCVANVPTSDEAVRGSVSFEWRRVERVMGLPATRCSGRLMGCRRRCWS